MTVKTRKPTGLPTWPILLLAGAEKAGKTYSAAEASASDLIGRTLWVGVGEDDPDEYGALPGARFEIVEHDGTYRGILAALTACATEPPQGGKSKGAVVPNLIVLDSATRLWELLCDEQQHVANERARRKAEKYEKPLPDEDATITMDQWNTAKQRWAHCLDVLRGHQGPSIVTARLEEVTVLDKSGQPTKDRTWKVKAEKGLPFDVGAIVEMPRRGESYLVGVRSLRFKPAESGRTEYKPFTVDKLWRDLGVAEGVGERRHAHVDAEDKPAAEADVARAELRALCEENGWELRAVAAEYAAHADGAQLRDAANAAAIRRFAEDLTKQWAKPDAEAAA
ncbi:MAG TPA: hypothetical protein VFW64_12445 [Pseudonocardiaceae bacterium]|nr:hypothetical protein [Pseudonocardiaceae bacterium]